MSSRVSIFLAPLLVVLVGGHARAATEPPLQAALQRAALNAFPRVGVAMAGNATDALSRAREEVEQALSETGHEVVTISAAPIALPPSPELLRDVAALYRLSGLVVVEASDAAGSPTISLQLYDLGGARVFEFSGRDAVSAAPVAPVAAVAPVTAAGAGPPIDLRVLPLLEGPDFYRLIGRPDLADQYEHRRSVKTGFRVAGGITLGVGVVWGLLDLAATAFVGGAQAVLCPPASGSGANSGCQNGPSASGVPWLVALGGLGMLVVPSFVSTDPLSPAERRALLDVPAGPRGQPAMSVSIAPAPAPGGGSLLLGGRF
jgi:hypothetical protein